MGEILSVLRRRWPLVLLSALLAIAIAAGLYVKTGPTYKFTSSVLLLPPKVTPTAEDFTGGNPLFYLGSLTQARDLIIGELNSKNVQEAVKEQYPDTSYAATKDVLGTTPVVVITAEGRDEATARELSNHLTDIVPTTLESLQGRLNIGEKALISSEPLTVDEKPEVYHRDQLRSAIVAGGAVAAVCAGLIALVDGLLGSRRRKGGGRRAAGTSPDDDLPPTPRRANPPRPTAPDERSIAPDDATDLEREFDLATRIESAPSSHAHGRSRT